MANIIGPTSESAKILTISGQEHDLAGDWFITQVSEKDTEELQDILLTQLPELLGLFIRKNAEYGENAQTLGPKGQFADIWRKIAKLKTGLWDGNEDRLTTEGVDEILRDLIGHALLILSMRARGVE